MNATRISDSTTGICDVGLPCCPHGRAGTNSIGSENTFINGLKVHRLGDTGSCNCPHGGTFESVSASRTVYCNGKGITRIGDSTVCQSCGCGGSHISGSQNVFVGD